eukprot:6191050-Pleurochrysis_carterae.AAC.3
MAHNSIPTPVNVVASSQRSANPFADGSRYTGRLTKPQPFVFDDRGGRSPIKALQRPIPWTPDVVRAAFGEFGESCSQAVSHGASPACAEPSPDGDCGEPGANASRKQGDAHVEIGNGASNLLQMIDLECSELEADLARDCISATPRTAAVNLHDASQGTRDEGVRTPPRKTQDATAAGRAGEHACDGANGGAQPACSGAQLAFADGGYEPFVPSPFARPPETALPLPKDFSWTVERVGFLA